MYCRDRKGKTWFGGVTNMGRTRWETTLKKRTGLVDPRGRNWFRIRIRITRPFRNRSRVHIRSRPRRIDPPHDHSYGKRASFILTTLNLLFPSSSPFPLPLCFSFLCPSIALKKYKLRMFWCILCIFVHVGMHSYPSGSLRQRACSLSIYVVC